MGVAWFTLSFENPVRGPGEIIKTSLRQTEIDVKTADTKKKGNFMKGTVIRSVMGACALVLGMAGLVPSELHAGVCTVELDNTDPDGSLTNATACGKGSPTDASEASTTTALNLLSPGGINSWTHIDRDLVSAFDSDGGFSFTGTTSGAWTITDTSFTSYIIALKDGSPLAQDFLWFLIDMSVPLNGTWQMYGQNGNAKQISHMDLFGAGGRQVPEPGILFLLGSALLGLGVARRWSRRT